MSSPFQLVCFMSQTVTSSGASPEVILTSQFSFVRTTTDFEMESVIAQANRKMAPDILSIFIPAGHEYSFISSTVVRDVLNNGGNARCFLPQNVDIDKYLQLREVGCDGS